MTKLLGSDLLGAKTLALSASWAPNTIATKGNTIRTYFYDEHMLAPLAATPAYIHG
jgi:hypothetical protein